MISLTYSVVDGTDYHGTYTRPGVANAPNLKCYSFDSGGGCSEEISTESRAHAFGDIALGFPCGAYNDTSQILESQIDYRYYCRRTRHQQEFAYRFNEYNPKDTQKSYPHFTRRLITASAGQCFNYTMVDGPQNGWDGNKYYEYTNGTFSGNITIPRQSSTFDGTTYIYRAIKTPQQAHRYSCGPRCIWLWAHKALGHGESSTFYQCPITVNQVTVDLASNALKDTQKISDDLALHSAASIALQGRPSSSSPSSNKTWTQYQLYAFG